MEHRWGTRQALDLRICLRCSSGPAACGRMRDASLSGAYIQTATKLRLSQRVIVEPDYKDDDVVLDFGGIPAMIVRRDDHGLAVEWCEFAPRPISALLAPAAAPSRARIGGETISS